MNDAIDPGSKPYLIRLIVLVVIIVIAYPSYGASSGRDVPYIFEGVHGPQEHTTVPQAQHADWEQYQYGDTSRLAILLTDPDSAWLGLVHGLRTIGIPFCITRDYQEALRHHVVLVYPTISGSVLPDEALRALAQFPAAGGTLIGGGIVGGGLNEVFGFAEAQPSRLRHQIIFNTSHPLASAFTDEHERTIVFSNPSLGNDATNSYGYKRAQTSLARFSDGTTAITARKIGAGKAYAFGVDLGFVLLTGYNNRMDVARSYVNKFEPSLDVLLRLLSRIYREGEPNAVTLETVPDGKPLAVLMTHDIDSTPSIANATQYAQYEKSAGLNVTYFVQTKYVRDWNDDAFFNSAGLTLLKQLNALGMEVASHSVAHSLAFNKLPLGTGDESYPDYRPFVIDAQNTEGATVLGELRVSRFLLEHFLPCQHVVSFRPGYLRNPFSASQAMEATGYRFSSSVMANESLTHLPFRLTYGRETTGDTSIYEFPITIEDQEPPNLLERLPQALALADKLARYGGLFVVLLHPDIVGEKLEFERKLVSALRERAWFGSMREFGQFWAARDHVSVDVTSEGEKLRVVLDTREPMNGLTVRLPKNYHVVSAEPQNLTFNQTGELVVLGQLSGKGVLVLEPSDKAQSRQFWFWNNKAQ